MENENRNSFEERSERSDEGLQLIRTFAILNLQTVRLILLAIASIASVTSIATITAARSTTATTTASSSARTCGRSRLLALFGLRFRRLVHQQRLERQRVRQNEVPDVVAAYGHRVQADRIAASGRRHLHRLQVRVHRHVHAGDRAVQYGAVLQLDRHGLVTELHEERDELHDANREWAVASNSLRTDEWSGFHLASR